jgi:hypothetical protein
MMEAFAMLLCVMFGVVIGAVAMSYHDWRIEVTREMRLRDWQQGYPTPVTPGRYWVQEEDQHD